MSDNALIRALRSFGQGASNAVASNVSAPVDGIAWLLRKGGLPIPQNPVGGSDWMAQQGLTATPQNKLAGLLGETAGMVGPAVVQAAAPKIAGGLLALDDKAMDMARQGIERRMADGGMIQPIVPPNVAKNLNIAKQLPNDENFLAAVANTPGAQLSDDGLLMAIQRNQVPSQGMQPSVRGGVFYLPQGAAQAKHYSTGKNGYGGSERIAGETMFTNPLVAKGGTGGKAPAAAYDQLMGKGAYDTMRNDALKAYGQFGSGLSQRVPLVRAFLEKHAPELADHAEYIARNSAQGNQLAYALQEAAVGSKVRASGYDSVLGYSKGKQGPFLSEVFDVRESHYPDKFGGSKVWESLLK